jgi:glycosyltransferase involved in cell wall biosynthesis
MLNNEPLVTFLMLSFNSRDYVRSALNAAFEQSYNNLEIIVADDCSTDDTCELVKLMFADYAGNKSCKIIANSENKCTLNNFISAAESASGEVIVVSAADDMSRPNRVSEIVTQWLRNGRPGVVYSDCEIIDESGVVVSDSFLSQSQSPSSMAKSIFDVRRNDILGCSAAYSAEFVRQVPRISGRYLFEDSYMNFMSHYLNVNVLFISDSLVGYRSHGDSVSNSRLSLRRAGSEIEQQLRAAIYDRNKGEMFSCIALIAEADGNYDVARRTAEHAKKYHIKSEWSEYGLFKRASLIFGFGDTALKKWMLFRFFGLRFFVFSKSLVGFLR